MKLRAFLSVLILTVSTAVALVAQDCQGTPDSRTAALLRQEIRALALKSETVFDGLAKLNPQVDLGFAVEGIAGEPRSANPRFTISVQNKTVREILDLFVALDPRYQWRVDGRTINIFPRTTADSPDYFFNQSAATLSISEARDAGEALDQVMPQAAPGQSILQESIGGNLAFAKPWSATFHNCTLRQAFNRITEALGPTYGWQYAATADGSFKQMVIHSRLGRHAPDPNP